MGFLQDLGRGLIGQPADDIVIRYKHLQRLERAGRLSESGRKELHTLRHRMRLDV